MKFLVAGFGSIGRRHFRNLLALGEKDIVLYRTHHSTIPDDEIKGFPVETDLLKALAHRPDGVIISNPTACHLDVAIAAAQQGCHLLMEKPISHSMERIDILQKAVQQSGSRVVIGFQFRFHPGLIKTKSLIHDGRIGRPLSISAHWGEYLPNWHPWEDYRKSYSARSDLGGGVALTLCHPLDYLSWMFGAPEVLWAKAGKISDLEIAVDDIAEFQLMFPGGVLGNVHLDYFQQPAVHKLEITGTKGSLNWDNADGSLRLYAADSQVWEQHPVPSGFDRNQLFLDEMAHFIRVVKGEVESSCTLEDGIRAMVIALSAGR